MSSKRPINTISLFCEGNFYHLHFPWDAEIKEQINKLQRSDRTWLSPYHVTFELDCLDIVRTIAADAILRNPAWTFIDRTALTKFQVEDKEKLHQAKIGYELERSFAEFLRSDNCKSGTFTLVEWGKDWLKVQLTSLVGEETFAQIKQCSLDSGKLLIEERDNPRLKRGWWFKMALSPEIIALLLAKKTGNISHVGALTKRSEQPESLPQVCHCKDESDNWWVGIAIEALPVKVLNGISTLHTWKLAELEGNWYWVGETNNILATLLIDGDRVCIEGLAQALSDLPLDKTLVELGLVNQCRQYLEKLYQLEVKPKFAPNRKLLYQSQGFLHPIDIFFAKLHSLPLAIKQNFVEIIDLPLTQWEQDIAQRKSLCAIAWQELDRAQAQTLALPIISSMSKQEILALGLEHGVNLVKSWSKSKMIEAIASCSHYQSICESILELPRLGERCPNQF